MPADARAHVRPGPAAPAGTGAWTMRGASTAAGTCLLLMAGFAALGYGVAVGGLVTAGDATRTATDVLASEGLFRFGIVSLSAVAALDVVVAWALHRVFLPVSPSVSTLAAVLRGVYAAVLAVAISHLASAVDLLGSGAEPAVALREIEAFDDTWNAGLGLFGLHLLLVGYLAHRSGFTPRVLGVLVALAGLGYAVDSVSAVLSAGTAPQVSPYLFVGEVLLAVWLLARGRLLTVGDPAPQPGTGGAAG